jgi:hypothetical protein
MLRDISQRQIVPILLITPALAWGAVQPKPAIPAPQIKTSEAELQADLLLARAKLFRDEGKFKEAAETMGEILRLEPQISIPPEFYYHYAVCLDKAGGDPGPAIASYREYVRQAGREGAFYGLAIEALAKAENKKKTQDAASSEAAKRKAQAGQTKVDLANIEQELARLQEHDKQLLAHLDEEAAKISGTFMAAFDALPWPDKTFHYRVTPGLRDGRSVRTVEWGWGSSRSQPGFSDKAVVDPRVMNTFLIQVYSNAKDIDSYCISFSTWTPDRDGKSVVEGYGIINRPYVWDTKQGYFSKVKELEAMLAPYLRRSEEAKVQIQASLERQSRLRAEGDALRRKLSQ